MDTNHPSDELDRTLEQYARNGLSRAMFEQLEPKRFDFKLSPQADKLLLDYADAHGSELSPVIAFLIAWCGGPLRDTVPPAFRVSLPAFPLIERQPLPRQEAERLAQALLVRFRQRESRGLRRDSPKHQCSFSVAMMKMLRMLAAYHSVHLTRIIETLIILVLPNEVATPNASKAPSRRRKRKSASVSP